ncbi:MAG: Dienelactone hydrolase family protein [uncultured Nocardioidaceae bacterium]|uniref:Dienelactone hydrolase family protein n=1 Tax=uncultured Nocardioidaceae bacterium TaxID=253824 RepID=A0A6J4L243_9ACTN|nr:MAG: Dienelactone hydrolase family protein [uncultured Nocardioidaceae bacterium]
MSARDTVATDTGEMPAYLWLPEGGTGPGLLLLQEIFGVSGYIQRRGADLAAAGYVVLAPELYWRLDTMRVDESAPSAIEDAMSLAGRLDWGDAVKDAVAALEHLQGRDEVRGGAGVIGFCLGGGLAFNVAAQESPDVLVSYYGSSIPGLLDLAPSVEMPSLHHFGLADTYIDQETVERIRAAVTADGRPAEFEVYPGADHAFDNNDLPLHHPEASALAWQRTLAFLDRTLPTMRGEAEPSEGGELTAPPEQ